MLLGARGRRRYSQFIGCGSGRLGGTAGRFTGGRDDREIEAEGCSPEEDIEVLDEMPSETF
jgi:hypothetical protein